MFYNEAVVELNTIADFLRFGYSKAREANLYYGHGTDNAWDDIWMLVAGSLSLPFDVDKVLLGTKLTKSEKVYLAIQLEKRIKKQIPVPYLTNRAYFCDLEFYIDNRVLIPRSPIAELINSAFLPFLDSKKVERVLDLCTGSGCIAIACCYEFPDAVVDAVDISSDALNVAKINQDKHELHHQLKLVKSDCFKNLPLVKYDLIVSNPPYVGDLEMQTLPAEYHHEPKLALECANNGLEIVDNILRNAGKFLTKDGILVVEVGNSADLLQNTYPQIPFLWVDFENGGDGVFILTVEQLEAINLDSFEM
ncbi:MAG: ribosomal protein L3 N(5)-glutamine methyltransferase [Legionellales bacterium RIFCSPHIGHO2_12_FULL_35_11]|nr:MAG: ribosomal protein L3 N(5)-glutamine methyltransferase [Legionellales bacterium RIFCSPHIGHO2_12_FULL_35_11]